jgi:hypothetical protein
LRRFLLPAACLLLSVAQAHAGLVLHYKFDETSGTTATDSSGSGNTGTLTNMAGSEWTTGKVGGALDFDGTNDYVNLGSVASSDPLALAGSAFTFAAWINPTLTGDSHQRIVDKSTNQSGADGYVLRVGTSGSDYGKFGLSVNWNVYSTVSAEVVPDTWSHVAATGDGVNYKLYVNGAEVSGELVLGSSYPLPPSSTVNMRIGNWTNDNRNFNGSIDDLRIYDSALSAGEVAALAGSAPEPAETFAFLSLLTAFGLGEREWRGRKAKTA